MQQLQHTTPIAVMNTAINSPTKLMPVAAATVVVATTEVTATAPAITAVSSPSLDPELAETNGL
jgi:hypothetical protein